MSPQTPKISGFTIVRNAEILGYPFQESVLSLLPLCDEFVINCGDSEDGTADICEKLRVAHPEKIKVLRTVWQRDAQSGGFQLKHQTDRALAECQGEWCFYIQCDEVVHESDLPQLAMAVDKYSAREDVDGLVFDYLHFYGSYDYVIRGRNWYRREVRLFKNHRGIEAFRDAQGFRKDGARLKGVLAYARVFHYGYVRDEASLKTKSTHMAQWWGETPPDSSASFTLHRHVGLEKFKSTHPAVMAKRLQDRRTTFDPEKSPRKWDRSEFKNLVTLWWEAVFKFRIGEFRNYNLVAED